MWRQIKKVIEKVIVWIGVASAVLILMLGFIIAIIWMTVKFLATGK